MEPPSVLLKVRENYPDFLDLPWHLPLNDWPGRCNRIEEAPRGLSRHPMLFINYDGVLFAVKELPPITAEREYHNLIEMEALRVQAVTPVAYGSFSPLSPEGGERGLLITRFLDFSLPYRTLFMSSGFERYRENLLDAMAGLLVQLHLASVFWGDCSLSNTLFRRDAGALQAYLVDAETTEIYPHRLPPTLRYHDLEILETNVDREVNDLLASHKIFQPTNFSLADTGEYIRRRYQQVWEEINREEIIHAEERYRIQERIRALNKLGYSVGGVELEAAENGEKLRLRMMVTDRNFHRDQLMSLTGLKAEEHQAIQIMNEIQEVKAALSQDYDRDTPLNVAAFHWYEHIFLPVTRQLEPILSHVGAVELYCQVLEHKWFLSEKARQDVGHIAATADYLKKFPRSNRPQDLAEP
jgi:hypothetical protein